MNLDLADPKDKVVVWWVVDHKSDTRHAVLADPTALEDHTEIPRLCGGQIALAKPGSRPRPKSFGIETFCGSCVAQSIGRCYGRERQDRFHF